MLSVGRMVDKSTDYLTNSLRLFVRSNGAKGVDVIDIGLSMNPRATNRHLNLSILPCFDLNLKYE